MREQFHTDKILYIQQAQPHYYWNSECSKIGSHPHSYKHEASNEIDIAMIAIAIAMVVATWPIALLLNLWAQREIPGGGFVKGGWLLHSAWFILHLDSLEVKRDHSIKSPKQRGNENRKPGAVETPPAS